MAFLAGQGKRATMGRAFLDVETSLLGQPWHERLDAAAAIQAVAIGQAHGVPDLLARVLAGRGHDTASTPAFLDPRLRASLPDPLSVQGVAPAVERLIAAIDGRERIAVFGDYDVDGACSAALLAGYLRAAGVETAVHIPDRVSEGYGPSAPALTRLRQDGADLLVTVDCGTTSFAALGHAATLGLATIVIDHHQAEAALPPAVAVVNPNRQDDLSGLGHLCAAGVVFLVLVALHGALRRRGFWSGREAPDLLATLDLVGLATVADVVPLVGLNRAFVSQGLAVMRLRGRPGLAALSDVAGLTGPPEAFHLGFLLGPRINAGGRIGDASLGTRLLLAEDALEARAIAETLDGLNRERRGIEALALDEAEVEAVKALAAVDATGGGALVACGPGWHPGIVGLVAARLRERYDRPAFAIAVQAGIGTGSGRSVPGVDLGRVVRGAVGAGLLLKGGGHAMAAGLTLAMDRLPDFQAYLDTHLGAGVTAARAGARLLVDASLTAAGADVALVEQLQRAAPYGAGNPEPVIAFARHRLVDVAAAGTEHLRLTTLAPDGTRLVAVAFRAAGSAFGTELAAARGRLLHLAGTLSISRWGGRARTELRLLDAARPEPS